MKNRNILISGASVAGPALAYWLRRHGFQPTVVERAPALRDGGYAVDFQGAALEVVRRMGLLPKVQRAATGMGPAFYVDGNGRRLASMPTSLISGEVEVLRGDVSRILYQATAADTEYVFGDSITSLSPGAEGVEVTFERGPSRTFDLVIGADGLHSNVRALAFGEESRFVRPLGYYVSIFTIPNYLGLDHTGLYYNSPGKVAAIYSARHNSEAKASFYFAAPPLPYDHRDIEQQKQIVADTFAGEGWEVPRLLGAMRTSPDFYFDSISQVHMERWSRGRTALLGDAAYCASPLSGQGTGLALVGAYVLAGELAAAAGEHQAAFAAYQTQMRELVRACQKLAVGAGKWFVAESRARMWLRHQNLRLLPHLPWKGLITAGPRQAAGSITLKPYPVARASGNQRLATVEAS